MPRAEINLDGTGGDSWGSSEGLPRTERDKAVPGYSAQGQGYDGISRGV
jgi:hypothetical protein